MFAQEDFSPEDEVGDDAEDGHEDEGVGQDALHHLAENIQKKRHYSHATVHLFKQLCLTDSDHCYIPTLSPQLYENTVMQTQSSPGLRMQRVGIVLDYGHILACLM